MTTAKTTGSAGTQEQVENRLRLLGSHGQSIWLDFISRQFLEQGELRKLVDEDGLRGVTSNPSIFEKAIVKGAEYNEQLESILAEPESSALSANDIYELLAVRDIQTACDTLNGVYEETKGRDGYVSMEVSPLLASDTKATIEEAKRLWSTIQRANLMIKVPGTKEGVPAIKELIASGINVNVTLLFSRAAYREVAEAYMEGLEELARRGGDLSGIASVASFFVSRIDSAIDALLSEKQEEAQSDKERSRLGKLKGRAAIANAKLAYEIYRDLFTSERWKKLVSGGARPQRLLWASTSTKDPSYPDTLYVDELIGNETVNTLPLETITAFRDHGTLADTLEGHLEEARELMESLENAGISIDEVTDALLEDGVNKFAISFQQLIEAVRSKRRLSTVSLRESMSYRLPESISRAVKEEMALWDKEKKTERLWARDSSVWTGADEDQWLDWLTVVDKQLLELRSIADFAKYVRDRDLEDLVVLGMGGSSLCPEVLSLTFPRADGHEKYPRLQILDSTNPAQVSALKERLELSKTAFIVASKSGSTLEPNIFMSYFMKEVEKAVGLEKLGEHFIAITDPGSSLEKFARENKFARIFHGLPSIGGRYSALSAFGIIPAASMGLSVERLLERAADMVAACRECDSVIENPGALLGLILGICNRQGRDKLTIFTSPSLSPLGAWLEQLIAESTGKNGKAIIPVNLETPAVPTVYGDDRVFLYVGLKDEQPEQLSALLSELAEKGHPVVNIECEHLYDLSSEFFRFEFATACAGAVMGINPFDQPDVEASKVATRSLTDAFEKEGSLPAETPIARISEDGCELSLYADSRYADLLKERTGGDAEFTKLLGSHFSSMQAGDYFAILAYLEMNLEIDSALQELRHCLRDSKKIATCLGFGPRFLHSTGQAYKGGPNSGVFLQVTAEHGLDLPVPDRKFTFGTVVDAQARGDFSVLTERERRAVRVHISGDLAKGLRLLRRIAI